MKVVFVKFLKEEKDFNLFKIYLNIVIFELNFIKRRKTQLIDPNLWLIYSSL